MEDQIEHEICGNCKKEIPHFNYVMHTAHCARNITLCQICKEPVPKSQFDDHKKECVGGGGGNVRKAKKKSTPPPPLPQQQQQRQQLQKETKLSSSYVEKNDNRIKQTRFKKEEISSAFSTSSMKNTTNTTIQVQAVQERNETSKMTNGNAASYTNGPSKLYAPKSGMLACKFCDLELPKLDLEEHENYCGARTDKCNVCGELVMFKYKKIHEDSNHGFLKLNDEPGPKPSWDSTTERRASDSFSGGRSRQPFTYETTRSIYENYVPPVYDLASSSNEKKESYKDISRRLDCKTEYIRNLLHDSASITVPIRHTGTVPRNHYNHNKGPAPQPPPSRRRNPPTELVIPCEFCNLPIPHEDLIQHETGCRPDLARRRRSPSPDDYFIAPPPSSPEVELPCEFCSDMIPASQLLRHQATCI